MRKKKQSGFKVFFEKFSAKTTKATGSPFAFMLACLVDDPVANSFFKTLPGSHQRYFSKWIDDAKTDQTRTKRIALAVNALAKEHNYGEMLRNSKKNEL